METVTKRKKRRTRKCLDEIRNRLRRKCGIISLEQNTKSCILESKKLENRLVTMDRLTLKSTFPKTVISETITRPILDEIKQKQNLNFEDDTKQDFSNNLNTTASYHNNISFTKYCQNNDNNHDEVESSSSLMLLSPAGSINKPVILSKCVTKEDAVASSTSLSQTSQDNIHSRYKELMNEMYISHMAYSINKEDTIEKSINDLQKLYMLSCQRGEENKIKYNVLTPSKIFRKEKQSIVENPLDYIRLEYEQEQKRDSGCPLQSLSVSPSPGQGAPQSLASPCDTSPDICTGIHSCDTPDYHYYPHPLK